MIYKIKIGLIAILSIFAVSLFFSENSDSSNKYLFSIKRAQETFYEKLQFSQKSKLNYKVSLLNQRLKELKQVTRSKKYDNLLDSSLRYSANAGEITALVNNNELLVYSDRIRQIFSQHSEEIKTLWNDYPKDQNLEYKYLEDDINYLKIYLDQISKN